MTDENPSDDDSTAEAILNRIGQAFTDRGGSWYAGEAVTQTEHALQAALQAEKSGAPSELIAAALLHDYGHLIHNFGEDCAESGIDDHHEDLGAKQLAKHFGSAVTEPIRMHVPAKRYLCAVEPGYLEDLSDASLLSLKLQGGPFTAAEAEEFIAQPHADDAVRLRRWDDQAKVVDLDTPDSSHFQKHVAAALA